jgi:hypothetical protein
MLTVEELRLRISTTLDDATLQSLLDAAETAIIGVIGAPDEVQEYLRASGDLIILSRSAAELTLVIENDVTLDEDDYELRSDGQTIRRLRTGPNPHSRWRGRIDLTYVPVDDVAERERVQAGLVELELNYTPGASSERIGDWQETIGGGGAQVQTYDQLRSSLLASLSGGLVML